MTNRMLDPGHVRDVGERLEAHLRLHVDRGALVGRDVAADAAGLASDLVVHALGLRLRGVFEPPGTSLAESFPGRVDEISEVLGAFPDTAAVLYATTDAEPVGAIVDRGDITDAIEVPSGERRPPRLPPVADVEPVCAAWLISAIPEFDPFLAAIDESTAGGVQPSVDPAGLARAAVEDLNGAGSRAHIEAKRVTWRAFGESQARQLAELTEEARRRPMPEDAYRRRIDRIVESMT